MFLFLNLLLLLFTNIHAKNISIENNDIKYEKAILNKRNDANRGLPSCKNIPEYLNLTYINNDFLLGESSYLSGLFSHDECSKIESYCIDEDNNDIIYGISTEENCKTDVYGVTLFEIISSKENKKIDNINSKVTNPDNLCIYYCTFASCKQTYGYIGIDNIVNALTVETTYYYVSPLKSGIAVITDVKSSLECSSHIGELVKNAEDDDHVEFCFADDYAIPFGYFYGYEIMTGVAGANNPFTDNIETESNILITLDTNYFVIENLFSCKYIYIEFFFYKIFYKHKFQYIINQKDDTIYI